MMMSVSKASEPSPSRRLSEPPEIRRKGEKPANMDQGLNPENLFAFVWFPLYPQIPQFTGFFVSDLCLSAGVWNPCNQQLKSLPPPLPEPERFVPATQYPLVTIISIRGSAGSQAQTSRKCPERLSWKSSPLESSPTKKEDLGGRSPPLMQQL